MRPAKQLVSILALPLLLILSACQPTGAAAVPAANSSGATATSVATLALQPASGLPGSTTTATGTGFPGGTRGNVVLTNSSGATISTVGIRTDRKGTFSTRLTIPTTAGGTLRATATIGRVSAVAEFQVTSPAPAPAPTPTTKVRFGLSTPGGAAKLAEVDQVAALVGEQPSLIMFFAGLTQAPDTTGLAAIAARGATPIVTLEPWIWTDGVNQPKFSLARIIAGDHDASFIRWADALKAHGKPVLLRFAHEMNGNWYPWAEGVNGNKTGEYVTAWRKVHGLFAGRGATNVRWVWAPNVNYPGSTPLAGLYPGDAYVDVAGMDGYNWGTSQSWSTWQSPGAIFNSTLAELQKLAPGKPVHVAEVASAEAGGNKATWIRDWFAWLAANPSVEAFTWFHHNKETDWRIDSSTSAGQAFKDGLAAR